MVAYAYQCARIITWDRAAGFNNHATFQVLAFLMGTQGDKRGIAAVDLNLQHPAKPSCRLGKGSPSKVARSSGSLPSMRNKRGARTVHRSSLPLQSAVTAVAILQPDSACVRRCVSSNIGDQFCSVPPRLPLPETLLIIFDAGLLHALFFSVPPALGDAFSGILNYDGCLNVREDP